MDFGHATICILAAASVFSSSIVIVSGPTPPGTGVMAPAIWRTDSKSTSPHSLPSTRLMPTSITVAPGFTISAVTNRGWPMAAIKMSAWRVISGRFRVRLWQIVTVASAWGPRWASIKRNRFADDFAAPEHHHVSAGGFDVVVNEQLLNPLRRAGQKPRPALNEQADVLRMKRIDIFQRMHGIENALFVDLLRQWKLDENAVNRINGRRVVQPHDQVEQFLLRRRGRQSV